MVQCHDARHRAIRRPVIPIRRDGLRKSPRSDSDSERPINNDLFLRSERQPSQKTTDGVTTTYLWDYANRLIALGSGGATTTYGYDAFGSRVYQPPVLTTIYPFKWYSIASSPGSGANYATSTEYVFNGDTLLSTTDQQFASGTATGTHKNSYIHPDHLNSTNVVTNASGAVVQTLDYYPYGATRINTSSGGADSTRKFIGQYADASNLDYLNARYYDPSRGQFISQDPVFWSKTTKS